MGNKDGEEIGKGIAVNVLKEAAKGYLESKYGKETATAFLFLAFGGYGVPGLVDGASLSAAASAQAAKDLTGELAVSLLSDLIKAGLIALLEARAAGALAAMGMTAEVFATASMAGLSVVFTPSKIGVEPEVPHGSPGKASQQQGQPATREHAHIDMHDIHEGSPRADLPHNDPPRPDHIDQPHIKIGNPASN